MTTESLHIIILIIACAAHAFHLYSKNYPQENGPYDMVAEQVDLARLLKFWSLSVVGGQVAAVGGQVAAVDYNICTPCP